MGNLIGYPFRMASKQRHDDYAGFSKWFRQTMIRRGYALEGPRAGGMTQLATDAEISLSAVSKFLNGKMLPEVPTMVKLAGPLNATIREMLLHTGRVLEEDLVADTGNPLVDPVLDRIYSLEHLPIEVRKARAEDFLRRVEEARRLTEYELEKDLMDHQGE